MKAASPLRPRRALPPRSFGGGAAASFSPPSLYICERNSEYFEASASRRDVVNAPPPPPLSEAPSAPPSRSARAKRSDVPTSTPQLTVIGPAAAAAAGAAAAAAGRRRRERALAVGDLLNAEIVVDARHLAHGSRTAPRPRRRRGRVNLLREVPAVFSHSISVLAHLPSGAIPIDTAASAETEVGVLVVARPPVTRAGFLVDAIAVQIGIPRVGAGHSQQVDRSRRRRCRRWRRRRDLVADLLNAKIVVAARRLAHGSRTAPCPRRRRGRVNPLREVPAAFSRPVSVLANLPSGAIPIDTAALHRCGAAEKAAAGRSCALVVARPPVARAGFLVVAIASQAGVTRVGAGHSQQLGGARLLARRPSRSRRRR